MWEVMLGNGGVREVGWLMHQRNVPCGRAAGEVIVTFEGEKQG